jgi:SAM-dependent methyltransferase
MKIPWLRHNFLARRTLDRLLLDPPDALLRWARGRSDLPPYSLRSFVGGSATFVDAGRFFLEDLNRLGLFGPGTRILEIGCGCGRVASSLASDYELTALGVSYCGMDVDRASVQWCDRHISKRNPKFRFYHADCFNPSYNPAGSVTAESYSFPHADQSQDLILLTSVLTHILPDELTHYLSEISRLLAPDGVAYTSFFLYQTREEAAEETGRHSLSFPVARGHYAVNREDFPTNAVAYEECYIRQAVEAAGLKVLEPIRYGVQDLVLLTKLGDPTENLELKEGWHPLEEGTWRWTKKTFTVNVIRGMRAAGTLRFKFRVVRALLGSQGTLRVRAIVEGVRLPESQYSSTGEQLYAQDIPASVLFGASASVQFEVENEYQPAAGDLRELGVQVAFWTGRKDYRRPICPVSIS